MAGGKSVGTARSLSPPNSGLPEFGMMTGERVGVRGVTESVIP